MDPNGNRSVRAGHGRPGSRAQVVATCEEQCLARLEEVDPAAIVITERGKPVLQCHSIIRTEATRIAPIDPPR